MRISTPFALVALVSFALPAAAAQRTPVEDPVPYSLRAIESGQPVPMAHRPFVQVSPLRERLDGTMSTAAVRAPVGVAEPGEYGITFQYDGPRAALEAAGIRVQSQIGSYFTARVRPGEVASLRAVPGLRSVRLERYLHPHLNVSLPDVRADLEHAASGAPPVYAGRAGAGILIGDVDSGIDITNPDFLGADGKTRILYIWDQNDAVGPAPAGYAYGSEWTKSQIDNTPGSVRHTDTNGHGTNVAGVLIGSGQGTGCSQSAWRYVGMAPQAQFIEVATTFSDAAIVDGVNYIFQKAAALGMDCVVNLSLGSQFSPHDGSDAFAQALNALTGPGRIIVASTGNDQEDNIHAKLTTTTTTVGTDRFTFLVGTYTANAGAWNDYVLITGWYDPSASMTIRVKGPLAADTLSVGFGDTKDKILTTSSGKGGKIFVANNNVYWGYDGTSTLRQFEVEVYDSTGAPPRAGTWEVDVVPNGAGSVGARVDAWIYAYWTGSALTQMMVNRDLSTMVGDPAEADSIIAVGAHATKASWASCLAGGTCSYSVPPTLGAIASFSNIGPRRDGVQKPDLTAPGFGVGTSHSAAAGSLTACADADDGVHEVTQGTSFSAPHVSGAVALWLQYQPQSSPSKVRQNFRAHARTDAFTGAVPNPTWGYGKLDIYATIDHVLPVCTVTSPVGGEIWGQGTTHTITWTASDNVAVTTVDVAYSKHGTGGPWVAIATGVANTGSRSWVLPAGASDSVLVRVAAHDAGNNAGLGQSASLFHISTTVDVPQAGPATLWLAPPAPNPSGRAVSLRYALPAAGPASVEVFGVRGERVWGQAYAMQSAGTHEITWDGHAAGGRRAGTGLYFVRLTTAAGTRTVRMVRYE